MAGVRRLVFVSSAGVLGQISPPGGFDDSHLPNPYDSYTRSKLEAEHSVLDAQSTGLEVAIVRPVLVYGPGARGNFDRLLAAVLAGWPLPVGGISARRSMIGVRNLTDLLLRTSICPEAVGRTVLAADDKAVTVGEFVREIAAAAHRRARVISVPSPLLHLALAALGKKADIARLTQPFETHAVDARTRLGWVQTHTMRDELAWTLRVVGPQPRESMNVSALWLPFVVSFGFAVLLTLGARHFALRHSMLDVPNARSSHTVPTPRGGGVAIVMVLVVGLGLLATFARVDAAAYAMIAMAGAAVAVVGLIDDRRGLSVRVRFVVQHRCCGRGYRRNVPGRPLWSCLVWRQGLLSHAW